MYEYGCHLGRNPKKRVDLVAGEHSNTRVLLVAGSSNANTRVFLVAGGSNGRRLSMSGSTSSNCIDTVEHRSCGLEVVNTVGLMSSISWTGLISSHLPNEDGCRVGRDPQKGIVFVAGPCTEKTAHSSPLVFAGGSNGWRLSKSGSTSSNCG